MNIYGNFSGSRLHGGPSFPQFGLCLVTRRWRSNLQIVPGWLTPSPFHSQQVSWLFACWTAPGCLHNANIPSTLPILLLNQVRKPSSSVPLKNRGQGRACNCHFPAWGSFLILYLYGFIIRNVVVRTANKWPLETADSAAENSIFSCHCSLPLSLS